MVVLDRGCRFYVNFWGEVLASAKVRWWSGWGAAARQSGGWRRRMKFQESVTGQVARRAFGGLMLAILVGACARSRTKVGGVAHVERRGETVSSTATRPDPYACQTASDCVLAPTVYEANECCDAGLASAQYARAYVEWRRGWVKANCEMADRAGGARCTCCPIPDGTHPPGLPAPCYFEVHCKDGRCTDGCGEG